MKCSARSRENRELEGVCGWKQVIKAHMVRALQGFGDMEHLAFEYCHSPSPWMRY